MIRVDVLVRMQEVMGSAYESAGRKKGVYKGNLHNPSAGSCRVNRVLPQLIDPFFWTLNKLNNQEAF